MSLLDLVLVAVRLAVGAWLLWSVRRVVVGSGAPRFDLSQVSVVVPARDEAASLPRLLETIPPGPEVIVVDDGSSDGTAVVAALAGARVIESAAPPPGWIAGKAWACEQGASAASGAVLVFVDADVRFAPGGLAAVVDRLDRDGGLVSVQPHHAPGRPVERLASIFNVVGFAATDAGSPLGRRRGARGAFGPVLATRAADHRAVGGHVAARATVLDDVALAERYRDAGLDVEVLAGGDAVEFRMYPGGFAQMVEGFAKNLASGLGRIRRSTALAVVCWLTLLVQAGVAPVRAAVSGDAVALAAAVGLYLVVAAECWWMSSRVGRFGPGLALLFPVSTALFLGVFARSLVSTLRGSVNWKGRRVPTRRA